MFSPRLWRQGPFVRYTLGATLSVIGTWFNTVAVAVLAYHLTGQVALVATAIAASVLPRVVLAPIGGVLADRFERRDLLVTLDLASAGVALTPLLVHDRAMLPLLYVAIVALQAANCLYRPAQKAYMGHLVPDNLLEGATAAYSTLLDTSMFVGPALAAPVLGLWGPAACFVSNAASFLVSALLLLTVPRAGRPAERGTGPGHLLAGYAAIVRRYPRLVALYLCGFSSVVPIFFFQGIMVRYAATLDQPSTFIGLLYAAAGIGGALGGIAMGHLQRRLPPAAAIAIYVANVPLLGALALVHQPIPALLLLIGSAAATTTGDLIFGVHVQRYVPNGERGRAFGLLYWCFAVGQLAGAGLGIGVAAAAVVPALLVISLAVLPLTLAGLLLFLRGDRVAPDRVPAVAAVA